LPFRLEDALLSIPRLMFLAVTVGAEHFQVIGVFAPEVCVLPVMHFQRFAVAAPLTPEVRADQRPASLVPPFRRFEIPHVFAFVRA